MRAERAIIAPQTTRRTEWLAQILRETKCVSRRMTTEMGLEGARNYCIANNVEQAA